MSLLETSQAYTAHSQNLARIMNACQELLSSEAAHDTLKYLVSRVSPTMMSKFQFGYFPSAEHLHLLTDKIGSEILLESGVAYQALIQDHNYVVPTLVGTLQNHNLLLSYTDLYGNIVALVGRTLLSDEQRKQQGIDKYKNSKFSKSVYLFGLHQAKSTILEQGSVILVEGQLDCISCHQYGLTNTVALGGLACNKYQFSQLLRYAKVVYLLLDNDSKGKEGQAKIVQQLGSYLPIKPLYLPPNYKDADAFLKSEDNHWQGMELLAYLTKEK